MIYFTAGHNLSEKDKEMDGKKRTGRQTNKEQNIEADDRQYRQLCGKTVCL